MINPILFIAAYNYIRRFVYVIY